MSHHQSAGQNHNLKITNPSKMSAEFRYWRMTVTYENCICKEIKSRSFRECLLPFSSESFVFPFPVLKENIKIYKTVILPVLLCGYETKSLA
jgi:hypothetical protein